MPKWPLCAPNSCGNRAIRATEDGSTRREVQELYDPRNEHDSCGVGFVANIKGRKSHDIIRRGLEILVNTSIIAAAVGADPLGRRRRSLPDPDPRRAAAALVRGHARARIAGARTLCCCDVLPADRGEGAGLCHRSYGAVYPGRGTGTASLAGCADRHDRAWQAGHRDDALYRAGDCLRRAPISPIRTCAFERKILTDQEADPEPSLDLGRRAPAGVARAWGFLHPVLIPTRTVVYKGLLLAPQIGSFYEDLRNSANRVGAGAGASALLNPTPFQSLAPRAPVPIPLS